MLFRIIFDENGQTCNRFWSYLDSVSWAILNKKKVYIMYWDPSLKYYNKLRKCPYVSFPLYNEKKIARYGDKEYIKKLHKIFGNIFFNYFFAHVRSLFGIVQFVRGWETRNIRSNHLKVGQFAYNYFLPNDDIIEEVNTYFDEVKNKADVIVGLHIRKGDYKTWLNGSYYFEDYIYESLMSQVEEIFPQKKVIFFVATNGEISDLITRKHSIFRIKSGTAAHDLFGLSKCDYIIGPPSTFSKWAALVGKVPLHHVYDKNEKLSVDSFSYSVALSDWVI